MGHTAAASGSDQEVVDPVCGEVFPPDLAVFHSEHEGQTVYFCSKTCKETFEAAPADHPPVDPTDVEESG